MKDISEFIININLKGFNFIQNLWLSLKCDINIP